MGSPSYDNFLYAAGNVISALQDIGETWCCLVGGMAVRLQGIRREVKDLDILILNPDMEQDAIQRALVRAYPAQFYLDRPRDPNATFMKLFYRIPRTPHSIKVDLLLSTEDDCEIPPSLHATHFEYFNQLPVAPLYFILYHKLLGWEKRFDSLEKWRRNKAATTDYNDIFDLCEMLFDEDTKPLAKTHLGRLYLENFQSRAELFADSYGKNARTVLRRVGFPL